MSQPVMRNNSRGIVFGQLCNYVVALGSVAIFVACFQEFDLRNGRGVIAPNYFLKNDFWLDCADLT